MILSSYAKVNLYLEVLNKRKDSYHNIRTIFERIDLCDKIILKPRQDKKISLTHNSPDLPCDISQNLAYKSAKILQEELNKGADIRILKRITVGSGLGGGSSNAAAVLLGLNKLWKLNLRQNRLAAFAGKIGCDVPFFIYNCPFALAEARGDKIKPLKALGKLRLWHILVVPKLKVSTPVIYKGWDKLSAAGLRGKARLTIPGYNAKILTSALRKNNPELTAKALFNNLEQVTLKIYPAVRRLKEKLISLGLKSILMSGSGPAVFALVSSRKEALFLSRQLKEGNKSWKIFVSRTI